jgi:pimeloyl-ACP methyl ester carboxylesterase
VVSYDRAGLAFSEAAEGPRDAMSIARELDQLLTKAGEKAPYVLVGHSYGALFASEYAALYPQKMAGVVLVDGTHPDQVTRSQEMRDSMDLFRQLFHVTSGAAHFGVMRFTNVFSVMAEGLSSEKLDVVRALYASPRHLESSARELDAWGDTTRQAKSVQFGGYPKLFLSASGPDTPEVRVFTALHQELADRYPGAVHRILPGTSHIAMVTHGDQSKQVVDAVLEVVDDVRRQRTVSNAGDIRPSPALRRAARRAHGGPVRLGVTVQRRDAARASLATGARRVFRKTENLFVLRF